MKRVVQALEARVLPVAPPVRPAVLRLVTGGWTAYYLSRRVDMLRSIHRGDPKLFDPVGPCRLLNSPLPPPLADGIMYAELVASAAFTLGLKHRVVGPAHAALLLWTMSYRNSWSMIFHNDNNLVLHTAVLGLTPTADALSIDAIRSDARLAPELLDWRYGLPSTVINAVTTATYLVAGIAKLKGPLGWSWADGESLRSQIAADGLRKELLGSGAAPLGVQLYEHTGLFRLLATGSLALELAAPIALLDRRVAKAWAAGAFGMHWGIRALMGITFRHQMSGAMFASFFPVDSLRTRRIRR